MYPAREVRGRWRAVWYENGQRRQCEAASEDRLAVRLEKVAERLAADAPNLERLGADLIAYYLSPGAAGSHPERRGQGVTGATGPRVQQRRPLRANGWGCSAKSPRGAGTGDGRGFRGGTRLQRAGDGRSGCYRSSLASAARAEDPADRAAAPVRGQVDLGAEPATGPRVSAPIPADTIPLGPLGGMFGVAFSPNAQLPASLRYGGTVRLWHISAFINLCATLCADVGAPTRQEWKQYAAGEPQPRVC